MRKQVFKTLQLIAAEEGRICNRTAHLEGKIIIFFLYWGHFMPPLIDRHVMPRVFKFGQGFAMPGQKLVTKIDNKVVPGAPVQIMV